MFERVPLTADDLARHRDVIDSVSAAMVDIGSNPEMGVRACAQLRALRSDLRIVVVVCCSKPTLISHIAQLVDLGVNDILDASVQPEELMASLTAMGSSRHETRIHLQRPYEAP